MNVLAIESSGRVNSVALLKNGKSVGERFLPQGVTTSQGLLTLIDELLRSSEYNLSELNLIAITNGPGSFTSLRVGASIVKGLAWIHKTPVVGINTLDALAQQGKHSSELICSILNAHQGQVYAAFYEKQNNELVKKSEDLLIAPNELAARINQKVYFIGAGVSVYQKQLQKSLQELAVFCSDKHYSPQAIDVARLGLQQFELGKAVSPYELTPYYIRRPAAEVMWEENQKRAR